MGIQKCEIFYDNPTATYYAGQMVTGRLEFTFSSTKTYRGIQICFNGECRVQWHEGSRRKRRRRRQFKATQQYFNFQYYLSGSDTGDTLTLSPGKHTFPFTCSLPPDLPTSFEGKFGHLRYTIKVIINRPWKFDNNYKFAFTVLSAYDLNQNPVLKEEVNDYTSKTFGFFPFSLCQSAPLTLHIQLPCSGFVPGQSIPIKITCDNGSSQTISTFRISLHQSVKYFANSPWAKTRRQTEEVASLSTLKGVTPGESVIVVEKLTVPPLPASDLLNCGLIDLEYKITVKALGIGCCSLPPCMTLPIKIGTLPIQERVQQLQGGVHSIPTRQLVQSDTHYNQQQRGIIQSDVSSELPQSVASEYSEVYPTKISSGSTVPSYAVPIQQPPAYSQLPTNSNQQEEFTPQYSIPPPTYEESQYRATTIQEQDDNEFTNVGTQDFAPRYPVFNFSGS